jgi:dTDP-4-dehydrorhamnose 3,5-epimerase
MQLACGTELVATSGGRNLSASMSIGDEVRLFEPVVHEDDRGTFYESYNEDTFTRWLGRTVRFVQDSHSISARGALRGLHYQLPPMAQAKLVRVTRGRVFDVTVDIRAASPSFGEWRGFELSADNRLQLWIPEGFAHGFLALTDGAEVQYKITAFYSAPHDRSIRWNDPDIGIRWPLDDGSPLLSDKDAWAPSLAEAQVFD